MDFAILADGLINYLFLVVIITFHEFGHAWMANRCGDDTARLQGRITLNPIMHMDLIGTVILPLVAVLLGAAGSGLAGFLIGWGRPVPVNIGRLRNPQRDDILVSLAGPGMNVVLALGAMALVRVGVSANSDLLVEGMQRLALLSMFLCFFNLLPIPPLDGSHVLKNLIGMSYESFIRFSQYGLFLVIVAIQIPFVRSLLHLSTEGSLTLMARMFGM